MSDDQDDPSQDALAKLRKFLESLDVAEKLNIEVGGEESRVMTITRELPGGSQQSLFVIVEDSDGGAYDLFSGYPEGGGEPVQTWHENIEDVIDYIRDNFPRPPRARGIGLVQGGGDDPGPD